MYKHIIGGFIVVIIIITIQPLYSQWPNEYRLTNDDATSILDWRSNWNVAINKVGLSSFIYKHVVWTDDRGTGGDWEIYYKRQIPFGWSADIPLTSDLNDQTYSSIAVMGQRVHVVWEDANSGDIYYRRSTDNGANWDNAYAVTSEGTNHFPSIAVYGQYVYIVYANYGSTIDIYFIRNTDYGDPADWGNNEKISETPQYDLSDYPCVATQGSNVHVVWHDNRDGNYDIYYRRHPSYGSEETDWNNEYRITTNERYSQYPSIAVSDEYVYVVWQDEEGSNEEIFYIVNDNYGAANDWGSISSVTDDDDDISKDPCLACSGDELWVTWQDTRGTVDEIYYSYSTDNGTSWEVAEGAITSNDGDVSESPAICATNDSSFVVWDDHRHVSGNNNTEIYFNSWDPSKSNKTSLLTDAINSARTQITSKGIKLTAQLPCIATLSLTLYDAAGREVTNCTTNPHSKNFSFILKPGRLSSGVYFLRISQNEDFEVLTKVIVVK